MKKTSKVLAVMSGAILALSSVTSLSADALFAITSNPIVIDDSYEDTRGEFEWLSNPVLKDGNFVYNVSVQRKEGSPLTDITVYHDYRCNYTTFVVKNDKIDAFDEIYAKYSEELDMDYYYREDPSSNHLDWDVKAYMYDNGDENGMMTDDPAKASYKSELIMKMTAEMYKADCLAEADFIGLAAQVSYGECNSRVLINLGVENEENEIENVRKIAGDFHDTIVSYQKSVKNPDNNCYRIAMDFDEEEAFMEAIKEAYPNADCRTGDIAFNSSSSNVSAEPIDMLALFKAEESDQTAYGDINADGRIGIQDAICINKAVTGAITLNEYQTKASDLNCDGSIDMNDMDIILKYLVNEIDTLPLKQQ